MRSSRTGSVVATLVAFGVVTAIPLLASCDDPATPEPCTNIPAGGCPLSRGVACQDPACEAVYACREGNVWELEERCPPRTPVPDAGADVVSPSNDASIDAPPGAFGGPGCGTLQEPDCTLGFALACPSGCCGCEDLFVCENEAWSLWGSCGDGGISTH